MKSVRTCAAACLFGLACGGMVRAATIFDANVTPDVIFGTGNANGFFTVDQSGGVELGLRAKIPFTGVIHSNGDGTYSYSLAELLAADPTQRWNFDWTVNTDYLDASGIKIDDLTYLLQIDFLPGLLTDFLEFDPITPSVSAPFFDHSMGTNATPNGGGTEATDEASYLGLIAANNVCQQSWRHAFFPIHPTLTYDPTIDGVYDVVLSAFDGNSNLVARTGIQVIIGAGSTCGNGVVQAGEECDDGNLIETDACFSDCTINPSPVPAVSEWGLVAMALLGLVLGTVLFGRRRVAEG